MDWFLIAQIFSTLPHSNRSQDRIRQRPRNHGAALSKGIAERKMQKPVRTNWAERLTLAVLAAKLKKQTNRPTSQFKKMIRLVQPEKVFRWHRDIVRRKWTQENMGKRGRLRIDDQIEHLIVRLAKENLRLGYYKIEGELTKLGFDISLTTVRNVLGRNGIVPAPVRFGSIGWKTMFDHYKE